MGVLIDGYDLSVIGFSVLLISKEFKVSASSNPLVYALILSSALIGMAVGGVTFGRLADRLGRKTMFTIDLLFFIVFAALSALSRNVFQLILFRALMGIGIGADYPISSTIISEFSPAKQRGALLMYGIMYYWVGTLLAGVVNFLTLGLGVKLSWRVSLLVGALLAIPVVAARGLMPESVRWLIQKKKIEEARKIAEERIGATLGNAGNETPRKTAELFTTYLKPTLFLLVTWFCFDVGAYGLGFYTATLYKEYGINSLSKIALFGALSAPFPILSYYALMRMIDRYGRRIPTFLGFGVMLAVLLVLPYLIRVNALTLLPLFIIFASLEQWPGGTLSFAYSVELYPTSLRGVGQGLATSVSRIGAILGVTLFPLIQKQGLVYGTLFFVSFIIVALVVSYFLAPETKNYTLEEISSKVAR
jgi:Arabinose efflux permease